MPSILAVTIAAAAAILIWTALGALALRRMVPAALVLPLAPVAGWAGHSAIAVLVFRVLPFEILDVIAVAVLTGLALLAASQANAGAEQTAGPKVPAWTYAAAALLAMVPAAAILPKFAGDAVVFSGPIFDHAKVAMIDDMARLGLPAGNPFMETGGAPLAYYYLWHFSAAELALALGITGWEADAAMTWFSAFASLCGMMGLAVWLGGRRSAAILVVVLGGIASARWPLAWLFGPDTVDAVVGRAGGFAGWLFQAAWVPQHIMSAACVMLAVVLMTRLARAPHARLVGTLGLMAAAAFESSTWIGGITLAAAAPVAAAAIAVPLAPPQAKRFFTGLAVAAVIAAVIALPFLRDQLDAATLRGSGHTIAAGFYPVLGESVPESLRTILDPPAFWLVLLPLEFPAVYAAGLIGFAWLWPHRIEQRPELSGLGALAVSSLGVAWLLASTLADNNDLGWRAVLPGMMALTVFAAAALPGLLGNRPLARTAVVLTGIAAGIPGTVDLMLTDVVGHPSAAAAQFAESRQMWAAVRRHSGIAERVGNNPLLFAGLTPWPVNISWALLSDRRSCYAGRELTLVYTSLQRAEQEAADALFGRVFAGGGSPDDVRDLATRYGCDVIAMAASDGAWTNDPFGASPFYELVEAKAGQWRVYRAATPAEIVEPRHAAVIGNGLIGAGVIETQR